MVAMLNQWNCLDSILPEKDMTSSEQALVTYWSRFRALYPSHEIFGILSPSQLATALPIKLHGDEGRRILAARFFSADMLSPPKNLKGINECDVLFIILLAGKRKSPIMLLSWSPVLGRGTSKSIEQPVKKQMASQRLNMLLDDWYSTLI